jgi:hypothetical protein
MQAGKGCGNYKIEDIEAKIEEIIKGGLGNGSAH